MKRMLGTLVFLFSLSAVFPQEFQAGLRMSISSSIGTGKGYWDWTEGEIQRLFYPVPSYSGILQMESKKGWALESGITYSDNTSGLRMDNTIYLYRQKALEIPLMLKIYLSDNKIRPFMKLGPSLCYLFPGASFQSEDLSFDLLEDNKPGQPWQYGLKCGIGLDIAGKKNHWLLDFQLNSFYSSPDYSRSDGGTGNIRYHRFELGLGYLF